MNDEQREAIKFARAEYARRYRKEHPEKIKQIQDRYWSKKAREFLKQQEEATE